MEQENQLAGIFTFCGVHVHDAVICINPSAHHGALTTYMQLIHTHILQLLSPGPTIQKHIVKSTDFNLSPVHPRLMPRVEDANCPLITGLQDKGRRRGEGGGRHFIYHTVKVHSRSRKIN